MPLESILTALTAQGNLYRKKDLKLLMARIWAGGEGFRENPRVGAAASV